MTDLYQLMKELKTPASESKIFITPRGKNLEILTVYQLELDLEDQE
ncbi:hypothetical protein P9443_07845 [Peribacillus frigoritolerans]|nr:hypothetical protein [Peribacillus frigoritolerans]